jgi:hypothetical protein
VQPQTNTQKSQLREITDLSWNCSSETIALQIPEFELKKNEEERKKEEQDQTMSMERGSFCMRYNVTSFFERFVGNVPSS